MIKRSSVILVMFVLVVCLASALPAQESAAKTIKLRVSAEQANLRERPDISSAVVQQIPEGTILDADKKEGEWYLVRYTLEDGGVIAGYIHESLVTVLEPGKVPETKEPQRLEPERRPQTEREARGEPGRRAEGTAWPAGGSPFEISVSLGGSSINPEDLDLGAQGFADYNAAFLGIPGQGSIGALRFIYAAGVEATVRIMTWLAVGVSVDYSRGANASTVRYVADSTTQTFQASPSVRVVPVKAIVRFYPGRGFYFRGGLGYYSAKAGYEYRFDQTGSWQQWNGSATGHCFGAEVGAGGEWFIGRGMTIFAEAGFRMARVNSLSGTDVLRDSTGLTLPTSGALWYFTKQGADARNYPLLFVRDARPAEAGVVDARLAELNLSGTTFRAGVRFRF